MNTTADISPAVDVLLSLPTTTESERHTNIEDSKTKEPELSTTSLTCFIVSIICWCGCFVLFLLLLFQKMQSKLMMSTTIFRTILYIDLLLLLTASGLTGYFVLKKERTFIQNNIAKNNNDIVKVAQDMVILG